MRNSSVLLALPLCLALGASVARGRPDKVSVTALLERFSVAWPADRAGYRTKGDESWKAYARTLRDVVMPGKAAIPACRKGLTHANRQVRALAARALGFLKAEEAVPDLARVLASDSWATARLLAADALGQIRTEEALAHLSATAQEALVRPTMSPEDRSQ